MFTTKNLFALAGRHILIAFAVVVFSAVSIFFISKEITKISTETVENRRTEAMLSERASVLSDLKKETHIIGTNDAVIMHAFVPSNNILEFIAILESLAQRNGISQASRFTPPSVTEAESDLFSVTTISYQNTITANLSTITNYLKEFENLPYFTKIDSLSISSPEGDWRKSGTASWSASLLTQAIQ